MKVHTEYKENICKGKMVKCYCNKCRILSKHTVITDFYEDGCESGEYGTSWKNDYQIIKCDNCDEISFRLDGWFSEYCDCIPDGNDGSFEILYPENNENIRDEKEFDSLPFSLSDIYSEVIKSFNQRIYMLCAVGIRAILEGICKEQKIYQGIVSDKNGKEQTKRNLEGKIYGMLQAGIINKQEFNALHELRFLGNDAVHQLEIPSVSDINNALDIIEHLIEDVYELPLKSKKLQTRRGNK